MNDTLLLVLLIEMGAAALVWAAFPIHYWTSTGGAWKRTRHGRNVMALAMCLAVMILLTLAGMLPIPDAWLIVAALILWPTLAAVGIHRHWLLWHDQHPHTPTPPEGD